MAPSDQKNIITANLWLYFPEIIPSSVVVLISPIWAIQLLVGAHFLAALLLVVGVGLSVGAFISGVRLRHKWLVYFAILISLGAAWLAFALSK
jgi:hypothetical protein